ncbi:molybdopterin-guanine dinucleotide biosynthesis protein B [Persephonella hydrogeniphila]|uniref:Molybdopterin-guanine dinucleotide biosynthesis protein B n=1 Tax=Persephonella hydrogeniphila TaxID=198703 RepID=A0A285NBF7_9AQUI|nr:molybdopterin-guanine dinucleotide biosynthesis protein B [Persephonella hydrogeniphila]SNZ06795.1 molybdopterin-guanine dinucleotide biosynthesis protein B [Persephonella hydrogeniphila]
MDKKIPVISIVGIHNSGKTTFIERIIKILSEKGYKVGTIKHDPKGKAKTDTPGKDSYRMFNAGARQVVLASPKKITSYIRDDDYDPSDIIEKYMVSDLDIIIIEGFKGYRNTDKFEVIRKEEDRDLVISEKEGLKGVITDYYPYPLKFDVNRPEDFAEYIEKHYIKAEKHL